MSKHHNNTGKIIKYVAAGVAVAGVTYGAVQVGKFVANHKMEQVAETLLTEKYGDRLENKSVIIVDKRDSIFKRFLKVFSSAL